METRIGVVGIVIEKFENAKLVNGCTYRGYKCSNNSFTRKKLTMDEVEQEIKVLEGMGHKRIVIEAGEDPVNCSLDYIIEVLNKIYFVKFDNGSIRRININIAATTVEDYKRLKAADIGTYVLFQESYNKATYDGYHPKGPKHNYNYHTTAMDRAMEAGIGDVGIGVLYGLYDYQYETIAMLMHAEHLEEAFGVGPHRNLSFSKVHSNSLFHIQYHIAFQNALR